MKHTTKHTFLFLLFSFSFISVQAQSFSKQVGQDPISTPQGFSPVSPISYEGPEGSEGMGDRIVFWVHGLAGNESSWARAADASQHGGGGFLARKIESRRPEYGQHSSLNQSAEDLQTEIEVLTQGQNPDEHKSNFIIAHSQGGLVSQALLYKEYCNEVEEEHRFSGVVTFGSPHRGARIVNNVEDIKVLMGDACRALSEGPITEIKESFLGSLASFFFKKDVFDAFQSGACDFVQKTLPNLAKFERPTMQNYKVGAPELEEYANCPSPKVAKVAFFGVEPSDNLIWRTLNWVLKDVNEPTYWEANDDYELLEDINELKLNYEEKLEEIETSLLIFPRCTKLEWFLSPAFCLVRDRKVTKLQKLAKSYRIGVNWFNTVDDQWKKIIGAKSLQKVEKTYCRCLNKSTLETTEIEIDPNDLCVSPQGFSCKKITRLEISEVTKESDGVVLAESASDFPGANHNPSADALRRMPTSSHMQMRNNSALKRSLNDLYNGKVHEYFKTDIR